MGKDDDIKKNASFKGLTEHWSIVCVYVLHALNRHT